MNARIPELIGIEYSPWTEKARWALDHHAIAYRYTEHLLIFGMPSARIKLRRLAGDVTFPALVDGEARLVDSLRIARHADARGSGTRLFPAGRESEIERWNDVSELAADSIRALVIDRIARDREAQKAAVPRFVPAALRGPLAAMAGVGISYLNHGFNIGAKSLAEREDALRSALLALRAGLARSGGRYLLGGFSYADVAMAVALQGVRPVSDGYLPLAPATRRCWEHPGLAGEFADLVEWRDRLYAEHRRPRQGSG